MLEDLNKELSKNGLISRGGFNEADLGISDNKLISSYTSHIEQTAQSLIMVGVAGSDFWQIFNKSKEYNDGNPNPLDRWSKRIGDLLASEYGAYAVYPSDGPPYYPFIQWAKQCETIHSSKMGFSIHPEFGLWHAFRFALLFPKSLESVAAKVESKNPCSSCVDSPCLSSCPVNAYTKNGFDPDKCFEFLNDNDGGECRTLGCIARRACPEGAQYKYTPEHAAFHMTAFYDSQTLRVKALLANKVTKGNPK